MQCDTLSRAYDVRYTSLRAAAAHHPAAPHSATLWTSARLMLQVMYEDPSQIRMKESLNLFKQYANHKTLLNVPLLLALTKKDVFEANFDAAALKRTFPEFDGATSDDGIAFITKQFEARLEKRAPSAPFKVFVLDVTSSNDALSLLNAIRQLVATNRSYFLMSAVQSAVEKKAGGRNTGRGSSKGKASGSSS